MAGPGFKFAIYVTLFAAGIFLVKQYFNGPMCTSPARIDGKVVIVTGANTGIGKGTARDLVSRGAKVYLACRSMDRGQAAAQEILQQTGVPADRVQVMKLDLASMASIHSFVKDFKTRENHLHILVNNAGVGYHPYQLTDDGYVMTFGVNHLGTFLVTNLLLDTLKTSAPSRIVTVSSLAHDQAEWFDLDTFMDEENYKRFEMYGTSKLANVLFSRHLGNLLKGTGVTTYSLHPGVIVTDIGRYIITPPFDKVLHLGWLFMKDLEHGHQTTVCCAVSEEFSQQTGLYYSDCKVKESSQLAQNDTFAKELWEFSAYLTRLDEHLSAGAPTEVEDKEADGVDKTGVPETVENDSDVTDDIFSGGDLDTEIADDSASEIIDDNEEADSVETGEGVLTETLTDSTGDDLSERADTDEKREQTGTNWEQKSEQLDRTEDIADTSEQLKRTDGTDDTSSTESLADEKSDQVDDKDAEKNVLPEVLDDVKDKSTGKDIVIEAQSKLDETVVVEKEQEEDLGSNEIVLDEEVTGEDAVPKEVLPEMIDDIKTEEVQSRPVESSDETEP